MVEVLAHRFWMWILLFGRVSEVSYFFVLFFLFNLGLKLLKFDHGGIFSLLETGFDFKSSFDEISNSKILSCTCEILNLLRNSNRRKVGSNDDDSNCNDDDSNCCDGSEELDVDVMKLRDLVEIERDKVDVMC